MSKKVQFIIWTIIAIVAVALLGICIFNFVSMNNGGNVHPQVSIEFQDYGTVKFELYPEYAPNTVANFIKLAESGYYNDKVMYGKDSICLYFGRDENGEVADPTTESINYDTTEPYTYSIDGEFVANGFSQNTLRHEKGVISLIRNNYTEYFSDLYDESYNSGNSQIGIMMSDDAANLNGVYAAFGRVIEGMDILEKIYNETEIAVEEKEEDVVEEAEDEAEEVEAEESEEHEDDGGIKKFATYPKVASITVDTKGIDYGMPEIHEAFDYTEFLNQYLSSYTSTSY